MSLDENVPKNHPLLPFLSDDIQTLYSLIHRLTPNRKSKRAINEIGTVWKWIAGNPDHDDFQILADKINNVIDNNNNQIIVNRNILDRINNITNITNTIIKSVKNSDMLQNTFILHSKYKIDIMKEELSNINMAIHLAKANIVNAFILSNTEISQIQKIFLDEAMPYQNIEEALNFASIKIANNDKSIIYVMSIPKTLNVNCKIFTLKPVKKEKFILNTKFEKICKCNKEIYGLKNKCKKIEDVTICLRSDIENVTNDNCISKIMVNAYHNCSVTNSEHIREVEEIDTGILLLNNYKGNITTGNTVRNLSGTYLVKFNNSSIRVGDTNFTAEESTYARPLPAMLQHSQTRDDIEEVLSLQLLKSLHVKSNKRIERLNMEFRSSLFVNFGLTSTIIIFLIIVFIKRRGKANKIVVHNQIPEIITEIPETANKANESIPVQPKMSRPQKPGHRGSIYDIPYF